MIPYEQIAAAVPMSDICARYGVDIGHNHMAACPLHAEKTPSMRIYDHSYYCFGCSKGGNSINLVANLLGVPLSAAARQIDRDFALGLTGGAVNDADAARFRQKQKADKIIGERYRQALITIASLWHDYNADLATQTDPQRRAADIAACQALDYAEWHSEKSDLKEVEEIIGRYIND